MRLSPKPEAEAKAISNASRSPLGDPETKLKT